MLAILSVLLIISLSILVTRIATICLTYTGLSRDAARLQARSAFSGVGFTTRESESMVNHPVRRRILLLLMLLGNAGIVTVISSLILSFIGEHQKYGWSIKIGVLSGGIILLWLITKSNWLDSKLLRIIHWALRKYTYIDVKDYTNLLHLGTGFRVAEIMVEHNDWLADRKLNELMLTREGILVLGIKRKQGAYVGAPRGESRVNPADRLIVYGKVKSLRELEQRGKGSRGDQAHTDAVNKHQQYMGKIAK